MEGLGTDFARSWHAFPAGNAKAQVRGGAGGQTACGCRRVSQSVPREVTGSYIPTRRGEQPVPDAATPGSPNNVKGHVAGLSGVPSASQRTIQSGNPS